MNWELMTANEAEALAAGMYAGDKAELKALSEVFEVWATINWSTVEPLPEEEKAVEENPAYLSIPF